MLTKMFVRIEQSLKALLVVECFGFRSNNVEELISAMLEVSAVKQVIDRKVDTIIEKLKGSRSEIFGLLPLLYYQQALC